MSSSLPPVSSRGLPVHNFADLLIRTSSAASRLADATTTSIQEDGLRHARIKLDARHYKKPQFASQLLETLRKLRVRGWSSPQLSPEDVEIRKVSGALTNAVFFISCKTIQPAETLLLRIYRPSSSSLISRTRELRTLHLISMRYNIGPRIYGTFENGRIEEYFDSVALTPTDLRDPQISGWIAARMAELHSVDITDIDNITFGGSNTHGLDQSAIRTRRFEIAKCVKSWLDPAEKVLALPGVAESLRQELDLPRFRYEWDKYLAWALARPKTVGTRRVFTHNDAQYGNLLRLKDGSEGLDDHRQIIVVDFEYAAANPAAYDIANHFYEWTANYHGASPHLLSPSNYPTSFERCNFYSSYIRHAAILAEDPCCDNNDCGDKNNCPCSNLMEELDRDVGAWGPASHAGWAIWGIVQAKEDIEGGVDDPEFDYVGYARGRMTAFRLDLKKLGVDTQCPLVVEVFT